MFWLFGDSGVPIVFAASSQAPSQGALAEKTLQRAIQLANEKERGVSVVYDGIVYSPLKLKVESTGQNGFKNWNMRTPVFSGLSLIQSPLEADPYILSQLLEDAVNSLLYYQLYPGMRAEYVTTLIEKGAKNVFLELYDTGTAGLKSGPYSLKDVFSFGRKRGARFFCTSPPEAIIDFSGYSSSIELWREGAVPMGFLTTESSVARFLAASILSDDDEERADIMDSSLENQEPLSLRSNLKRSSRA
jgi:aspartyl-tRNA(Asn)/glutamyl-tRNA(Gln) amidotransferase subunit B